MFRDARLRGQLSAADMRRLGEMLGKAGFAWQSQGNNPPFDTSMGGIASTDDADIFFGIITHKTRLSLLSAWQYGFTEQILAPSGVFVEASEPRKCDGTKNWAYTKSGVDLNVGDFAIMRRSSYNPDLFEILFAIGGGSIAVCGTQHQRRLAITTDTECPACDTTGYPSTLRPVTGISFDPCAFRISPSTQCTDANSSSSGSSSGVTGVLIETQGFTGTWPTPWDIIFCPDTCEIKIQWAYGCFYKGIFLGYWLGPPVTCGGGS